MLAIAVAFSHENTAVWETQAAILGNVLGRERKLVAVTVATRLARTANVEQGMVGSIGRDTQNIASYR